MASATVIRPLLFCELNEVGETVSWAETRILQANQTTATQKERITSPILLNTSTPNSEPDKKPEPSDDQKPRRHYTATQYIARSGSHDGDSPMDSRESNLVHFEVSASPFEVPPVRRLRTTLFHGCTRLCKPISCRKNCFARGTRLELATRIGFSGQAGQTVDHQSGRED